MKAADHSSTDRGFPGGLLGALGRVWRWLRGRVAMNVYFWLLLWFLATSLNENNDAAYHYGITLSPWYWPVMVSILLLQMGMMYTNNLWLVPKFLAKGQRWVFVSGFLLLAVAISLLETIVLKLATPYLNTRQLQHVGFTTTILSDDWRLMRVLDECQTFLFSNLLFLLLYTAVWFARDYGRQQRLLLEAERARAATELAFLKNQINPHFLFNTLNNIYGLALKKLDGAPAAILKLSAMLRYLLYESSVAEISFDKEKAAVEAYVEIEGLRLPDDANVQLSLQADGHYELAPLLWLPLLENAFKHGTRVIGMPIDISFSMEINAGVLQIRTRNNYDAVLAEKGIGGIGLENLRKRLNLLYPKGYELLLHGHEGMYAADLVVRLH